jgi:hypothetical protein
MIEVLFVFNHKSELKRISSLGVYVCAASNEAARIETESELMIETLPPKAPSNLTANSTKDSITVRWTQNYIRSDMKFSIWYRLSDSLEWRVHEVKSSKKYESTIEGLESSREYEFMVLSQDRYNDGLFSKPYRYRTKGKKRGGQLLRFLN